jgi:hypothetical protein
MGGSRGCSGCAPPPPAESALFPAESALFVEECNFQCSSPYLLETPKKAFVHCTKQRKGTRSLHKTKNFPHKRHVSFIAQNQHFPHKRHLFMQKKKKTRKTRGILFPDARKMHIYYHLNFQIFLGEAGCWRVRKISAKNQLLLSMGIQFVQNVLS